MPNRGVSAKAGTPLFFRRSLCDNPPTTTMMKQRQYSACVLALVIVLVCANGRAATIAVLPGGGVDVIDIQAGVNAAISGDTLLLGPGTFMGSGNRDVTFGGKDVVITSQLGASATTIDCERAGRAFLYIGAETNASILEGVTITRGSGTLGGAIYCENGSPLIRRNILVANEASTSGGAIYKGFASPRIVDNVIIQNTANTNGGAIYLATGGATLIQRNTIMENSAGVFGGGLYATTTSPSIEDNTIAQNSAAVGGGIFLTNSFPGISGNTIAENSAGIGSGIYLDNSSPSIMRTIVAYNLGGAGITCQSGGFPTISCSLISGNEGGDALCGFDGGENTDSDPQFCGGSLSGNYGLQDDSPCSPALSLCNQLIGALGVDCSSVAAQEASWGRIKHRYSPPAEGP